MTFLLRDGRDVFARAPRPGGWRDEFTGEERRLLERIMGEELRELGYE
jgi:hypothetical protein